MSLKQKSEARSQKLEVRRKEEGEGMIKGRGNMEEEVPHL